MQHMQVLRGKLENYSKSRESANFVFTETDRNIMGSIAILASLAGMAGQAASTASSASDTTEPADFVKFTLNGKQVRGWLWCSPFKEGDEVEAVVEQHGDEYYVYALTRPADRLIALYPHCSRGRKAHWKNAAKWWFKGASWFALGFIVFGLIISLASDGTKGLDKVVLFLIPTSFIGSYLILGFAIVMLGYQWMSFVRLAEQIFTTLGWQDVRSIDLQARSKAKRTNPEPDTSGGYGYVYYRY